MSCSSNSKKPLMMSTLNHETTAANKKPLPPPLPSSSSSSPPHQESSSSYQADGKNGRGRKPAVKTPAAKKPPQRGLGVAQLERLRMQERWKKMTEMPSSANTATSNGQVQLLQQPLESVPVQYGAGAYGGRLGLLGGASGSFLFSAGNGSGAVMNHGSNHVPHDYHMINNNNIQTVNSQFLTPNAQFFDNFTLRKKRFNDEINGGDHNINNNNNNNNNNNDIIQMGNNNNNNNIYNDPNSIGEHLSLGYGTCSKVPRNSSSQSHSQEIEVSGVHKKKPNSNDKVVEYEFFPGLKIQNLANDNNNDGGDHIYNYNHDYHNDYDYNGNEASYNYANDVPANGRVSISSSNNNNNSLLDLSLKL